MESASGEQYWAAVSATEWYFLDRNTTIERHRVGWGKLRAGGWKKEAGQEDIFVSNLALYFYPGNSPKKLSEKQKRYKDAHQNRKPLGF